MDNTGGQQQSNEDRMTKDNFKQKQKAKKERRLAVARMNVHRPLTIRPEARLVVIHKIATCGLDTNMVKKRSVTANGQSPIHQRSTRNGQPLSGHTFLKSGSRSSPTSSLRSSSSKGHAKGQEMAKSKQISTNFTRVWVLISTIILLILSVIIFEYRQPIGLLFRNKNESANQQSAFFKPIIDGGWLLADDLTNSLYNSSICTIDRYFVDEISPENFEKNYRFKRPLIIKFPNGAKGWTNPRKWTVDSLSQEYGHWSVLSGNAREIVRRGGSGYVDTSFSNYVHEKIRANDSLGEPLYVFDREFYKDSSLPKTLHLPSYFEVKDDLDDSIFFLGSSGSGVSFHKHADAWNGVVYGRKRWFLYPVNKTPPGGVYPGYTQTEWFRKIYPQLTGNDRPMECIQEPGEIFYLPESTYHGTINLGDTIAIGIQKKEAQTEVEKLFYEENKIVGKMRGETDLKKKNKLLKRKKEIYLSLLKLLPDNSEVQLRAGQLFKEIGDMERAISYTESAIRMDPYFVVAVISLGEIHEQLGNADQAEQMFKQAIQMNPKLWDGFARYGDFLLDHNRPSEAVDIYKQGTSLEPGMLPFWNRLKLAQKRSGDSEGLKETEKIISKLRER